MRPNHTRVSKLVDASESGQLVLRISVASVARYLQASVTKLSAPREITVRVAGKPYLAVFTPDLEAGGYTVEVPALPGCLTEGDDLADAKRMTREAIGLWLDVDSTRKSPRRAAVR